MALSEATREQPLTELVGGIATDVETLVRKELTLTGQTIRDDLSVMIARVGLAIGASVFLVVGLLYLAFGSALLLNQATGGPAWTGFMTVGAVSALIAVIVGAAGAARRSSHG